MRPFYCSILLIFTNVIAFAQKSALANSEANYRALRDGTPKETYLVENIELKRDVGTVTLKNGKISFLPAVLNRVTLGVFTGEGRFQLKPAAPLEAQSIGKMIGRSDVDEEFTSAVIYFTDGTYDEIKRQGHAEAIDSAAANALKDFRNRTRQQVDQPRSLVEALIKGDDMLNADAEILAELYDVNQSGSCVLW